MKDFKLYIGYLLVKSSESYFSIWKIIIIIAILSRVYVQLDVRPVEEGYREVVCSWKSSEFESAEPCEKHLVFSLI